MSSPLLRQKKQTRNYYPHYDYTLADYVDVLGNMPHLERIDLNGTCGDLNRLRLLSTLPMKYVILSEYYLDIAGNVDGIIEVLSHVNTL